MREWASYLVSVGTTFACFAHSILCQIGYLRSEAYQFNIAPSNFFFLPSSLHALDNPLVCRVISTANFHILQFWQAPKIRSRVDEPWTGVDMVMPFQPRLDPLRLLLPRVSSGNPFKWRCISTPSARRKLIQASAPQRQPRQSMIRVPQ